METIQEKLEKLKQHTYTPNSFYDDLIDYIDGIEEHSGIVDGFMTDVNKYMSDNNDVIAHLLALVSGDLNIVIDVPPLVGVSLTDMSAGTETQEITIKMQDSKGIVHETFNGTLAYPHKPVAVSGRPKQCNHDLHSSKVSDIHCILQWNMRRRTVTLTRTGEAISGLLLPANRFSVLRLRIRRC